MESGGRARVREGTRCGYGSKATEGGNRAEGEVDGSPAEPKTRPDTSGPHAHASRASYRRDA